MFEVVPGGRRAVVGVVTILYCASVLIACASDKSDTFDLMAAEDLGPDPFVSGLSEPAPDELTSIISDIEVAADQAEADVPEHPTMSTGVDAPQVTQARQKAAVRLAEERGLDVARPGSQLGVGIFGGSGGEACDIEGMIGFFETEPGIAQEWGEILALSPSEIPIFLRDLEAGYLLDPYQVLNTRLVDGQAVPFESTLAAGTAVLVDESGIPRVRCKCGNPLQQPLPPLDLAALEGWWLSDSDDLLFLQPDQGDLVIEMPVPGETYLTEGDLGCGSYPRYEVLYDDRIFRFDPDGRLRSDQRVFGQVFTCDVKDYTVPFYLDPVREGVLGVFGDDTRLQDPEDTWVQVGIDLKSDDLVNNAATIEEELTPNTIYMYRIVLEEGEVYEIVLDQIAETDGIALSGWVGVATDNLRAIDLERNEELTSFQFRKELSTWIPDTLGSFEAEYTGEYALFVGGQSSERYAEEGQVTISVREVR